ncbi:MAG: serine hydrolase, partial [Gammaproteobacteria bacterium]
MTITLRAWAGCLLIAFATCAVADDRAPPLEPMVRPPPVAATRAPVAAKPAPPAQPATQARPVSAVDPARLKLRSASLVVIDPATSRVVVARDPEHVRPIASVTKLMTAMVVLDARLGLDELLRIAADDIDRLKGTHSRLPVGARLTRREMLHLALMASENRAASALARHYPGGFPAFVRAMNRKAKALGMQRTQFVDSTGLSRNNVSTARDLSRMVQAAHRYPVIRRFTTSASLAVRVAKGGAPLQFRNS